jgi:RHS repeat-associated protein
VQGAGIDEPLAQSGAALNFYSADGLGSITSLTDSTGTPSATFVYGAFGVLSSSSGTLANPYRYTAREYDQETGLYYYRTRHYNFEEGRFLSEDNFRFRSGPNFYQYGENRPVLYRDPTGNDVWIEGPSGHEPSQHLSINVGNPNGQYHSYSFGMTVPFVGEVYEDTTPNGDFLPGYYLHTSQHEDEVVNSYLQSLVGNLWFYTPWSTCRTFSFEQFEQIHDVMQIGIFHLPPPRHIASHDVGRYDGTNPAASTITDKQRHSTLNSLPLAPLEPFIVRIK